MIEPELTDEKGYLARAFATVGIEPDALVVGIEPTPAEIEADSISCEAGLGGSTPEDEMAVFPDFLKKLRKRMAPYGVTLPLFDHPRLGKV